MSTATVDAPVKSEVVTSVTVLAFPEQSFDVSAYKPRVDALKIDGINDKKGLKDVKACRMELVHMRNDLDDTRKEFKKPWSDGAKNVDKVADAIRVEIEALEAKCLKLETEHAKQVADAAEKEALALYSDRLAMWKATGSTTPVTRDYLLSFKGDEAFDQIIGLEERRVEARLEAEAVAREQAEENRRKQAELDAQAAHQKEVDARVRRLSTVRDYTERDVVAAMTDDEFTVYFTQQEEKHAANLKAAQEAEEKRQREAEVASRKQREVDDRLKQFTAVQYFPSREQVALMTDEGFAGYLQHATDEFNEQKRKEAEALAEQQRIADENAARIRQEQIQKAADEAAANAVLETEERLERQRQVQEAEQRAEQARLAKEAALRPAREKLNAFTIALQQLERPVIDQDTDSALYVILNLAIRDIRKLADSLEVPCLKS